MKNFTISVVIPTKNRPEDLKLAIISICNQSRLPDELIIVDQSKKNTSLQLTKNIFMKYPEIKLIYIHDPQIKGLVSAKKKSINVATGNIICFLEDDVILENEFIEYIELGFLRCPSMLGCCGIITNPVNQTKIYTYFYKFFHRGIFFDKRIDIYGSFMGHKNDLIPSSMLSGGLSAWKSKVFKFVKFDDKNNFHMFEDIDFSTRVNQFFKNSLYINPNARLAHYFSPIGRDRLGIRQRKKICECFTYFKKRRDWSWAKISFLWLLLGMCIEAIRESMQSKSFKPIIGYFLGLLDGIQKKIIS